MIPKQNRALVVAAAAFVVLVGLVFFGDRILPKGKDASSTPSPQPSPLLSVESTKIQQVVIRGSKKVLTVNREGSGWNYTLCDEGQGGCPVKPADTSRSAQLFQSVSALTPSHVIFGAPEGLPAYGVDKMSTGEISVKTTTGQQYTLLIGIKVQDGTEYFVKRQDATDVVSISTQTIDTEFLNLIDTPPDPQPSPSPGVTPSPSAPAPAGPIAPAPSPSA